MSHTPGPWHVGGLAGRETIIYASDGNPIADTKTYHGKHPLHVDADNARLIAAAPELLEALKALLSVISDTKEDRSIRLLSIVSGRPEFAAIDAACAVVAKAEGA